jgi:hypothetical protein
MSKEEILRKAIKKAARNGWAEFYDDIEESEFYQSNMIIVRGILFTHIFAKAFWGRKVIDNDFADELGCSDPYICDLHCGEAWEYHLQRMVISDDPLKYLEKFLDKK